MDILKKGDEHYMRMALREAEQAFSSDEIPVGCVVVCQERVIARAHNLTQRLNDVTAHAEMQAITSAAEHLGSKYLSECIMYVTLEPCAMCAGALKWAQLGKLVFGAFDEKAGYRTVSSKLLHPKTEVVGGIMQPECGDLLKAFFKKKRAL